MSFSETEKHSTTACTTLDPAWKHVETEPSLPVQHGEVVTLTCPERKNLVGSDVATCNDGKLFSVDLDPFCSEGKFDRNDKTWGRGVKH